MNGTKTYPVKFIYQPLTAGDYQVFLAADFNGFSPDRDRLINSNGIYAITKLLPEGRYTYKFVVNGMWLADEKAVEFTPDGFGSHNSVVYAGEPDKINRLKKILITRKVSSPGKYLYISGNFNNWSLRSDQLLEKEGGEYYIYLLLKSGEFEYKFSDGVKWLEKEVIEDNRPNDYGTNNNLLRVDDSFPVYDSEIGDKENLYWFGLFPPHKTSLYDLNGADQIIFKMKAYRHNLDKMVLILGKREFKMDVFATDLDFDYYQITFPLHHLTLPVDFAFRLESGNSLLYLQPPGFSFCPFQDMWTLDAEDLELTRTPDWVKEGIIYQIFPERFCNGNHNNDPDFREWYYKGRNQLPDTGKICSGQEYYHLVKDWYDIGGLRSNPCHEKGKPDTYSFYGGDIAGVREKLSYLIDLGITIIYFNPLFEARSNHKYDAADFMKIDPHFGTNDEFREFVQICHRNDIRVIIDIAFNHTGDTFWAFQDILDKGKESKYYHWYEWKKWPLPSDISNFNASEYYSCWWGFSHMPELDFDLDRFSPYENPIKNIAAARPNHDVVDHLLKVTAFWLQEMDIDGFRLDVPNEVPFWFWELFRNKVKELKPDAYIVGEIWHDAEEWINGNYCDAVMNYAFFKDPVVSFFNLRNCSARQFDLFIKKGLLTYPRASVQTMMNLIDSHDTYRYLEIARGDLVRLKLAVLFQMTFLGTPHIWYGDEIGMKGGHDPDCRRPFNWNYLNDESALDLRNYYKKLIKIRKANNTLIYGHFRTLLAEDMIYVFERYQEKERIVIAINNSDTSRSLSIPAQPGQKYINLMTGSIITPAGDNLTLAISSYHGQILKLIK
ncbi:MAG: alpha-glucosidase C-terminal domain-containing protein [Candidatus Cloacimonetes bacterium]|nr:alpha-glucosidase C-terminal domain-containing protein [Candidatus Cloacimonadota bacterium]